MGLRHAGRIAAVQLLYGIDTCGQLDRPGGLVDAFFAHLEPGIEPAARRFAEGLCRGVVENLEQLDREIQGASQNWRVARMNRIDRNILRVAVYELRHDEQLPDAVVINEAIELGKQLGAEESGPFINGVLGRVVQQR